MLTTTLPEGRSTHMPEAVPRGLGSTVHARGNMAWSRLTSKNGTLRDSNHAWIWAAISSCITSSVPKCSAKTCLGRSALVGPNPPVNRTASATSSARSNSRRIVSGSSDNVTTRDTRQPSSVNRLPIQAALVLAVWPMSSSSPMESKWTFMAQRWVGGQKKQHRSAAFSMSKAVNSLDREAHHRALRSLGQFDEVHA